MSVRQIPKVPIYRSDGHGRDTYIVFSNGGFNDYPYSRSYKKRSKVKKRLLCTISK